MAQTRFARAGITYLWADATQWQCLERFDAIVLSNVFEHIDKRVEFLKAIYEHQDRENPAILLLRVPMLTRDLITLYKKEQGLEWRLDPTHYTEYTQTSLSEELHAAGLYVESYEIQLESFMVL